MNIVDERAPVRSLINTIFDEDEENQVDTLKALNLKKLLYDLADLKLKNGRFLFEVENIPEIYDLYFLLKSDGPLSVQKFLVSIVIPTKNEMIERGEPELYPSIVFDSPLLDKERDNEEKAIALQDDRGELSESSSCGRCGSTKNYLKIAQTRSVDEGPTSIFTCSRCKNCWQLG